MRAITPLLALTLIVLPGAALAHTGHAGHGGEAATLMYGFGHPLGGIDHILAMLAVGVFAFVLGGRALWAVPLSFVAMMSAGFLLGLGQVELPFVELGIALSSVIIGGAAALGRPMPVAAAMALTGLFAIFHGHAHGAEMPADSSGLLYALGFVAATALLHGIGIGASAGAAQLAGRHGRTISRVVGGLFALAGIGVLAGWI